MTKSKSQERREAVLEEAKPKAALKEFMFPDIGKTVKAASLDEAIKKSKKL